MASPTTRMLFGKKKELEVDLVVQSLPMAQEALRNGFALEMKMRPVRRVWPARIYRHGLDKTWEAIEKSPQWSELFGPVDKKRGGLETDLFAGVAPYKPDGKDDAVDHRILRPRRIARLMALLGIGKKTAQKVPPKINVHIGRDALESVEPTKHPYSVFVAFVLEDVNDLYSRLAYIEAVLYHMYYLYRIPEAAILVGLVVREGGEKEMIHFDRKLGEFLRPESELGKCLPRLHTIASQKRLLIIEIGEETAAQGEATKGCNAGSSDIQVAAELIAKPKPCVQAN